MKVAMFRLADALGEEVRWVIDGASFSVYTDADGETKFAHREERHHSHEELVSLLKRSSSWERLP